jgi:hypothetical protein
MLSLLEALGRRGWTVRHAARPRELLSPAISGRYVGLPNEVRTFLSAIDACCSPDQTAWFLTADDYARTNGPALRWNEIEMMGLEAADGDPDWQREVTAFWDRHFPVMLAVHSDYDYLAVSLDSGAVVHGHAPEWAETSPVAGSFPEFLRALEAEAAAMQAKYPLALFLGAPG